MFRNMASSLFRHELIKTTLPKAKELRRVAEPMITMAKNDSVHTRRLAFSRLRDKEAVGKLFGELGPRYRERPGGYLRILKCGFRSGDAAPMAYVELVDRPIEEPAAIEAENPAFLALCSRLGPGRSDHAGRQSGQFRFIRDEQFERLGFLQQVLPEHSVQFGNPAVDLFHTGF